MNSRWYKIMPRRRSALAIATLALVSVSLLANAGCGGSGDTPSAPWSDDETVTFAVGETRALPGGSGSQLRLVAITKDTRYGLDELPSLPGIIEMRFVMTAPGNKQSEFIASPYQYTATMVSAGDGTQRYRIEIVDVQPGKKLADTIPADKYRVSVRAIRAGL